MNTSELVNTKINFLAREKELLKKKERRRNLILLIHKFLMDEGFIECSKLLISESNIDTEKYMICDNVDLRDILKDYETYCLLRFNKEPQICRKPSEALLNLRDIGKAHKPKAVKKESVTSIENNNKQTSQKESDNAKHNPMSQRSSREALLENALTVNSLSNPQLNQLIKIEDKPEPTYSFPDQSCNNEWLQFSGIIQKEIMHESLGVSWDDVIGLEVPKRILSEAIVYPTKYPDYFQGIMTPWKGLLLYGPPGTGKTRLAQAVASECCATFFNISASTLVSKWRGESEKLTRVMFDMARKMSPSIIFIDELDSLLCTRGAQSEHEASKRLKAELLIQLDGLAQTNDQVFFLGSTNMPWDLDQALLRRLEKRVLVDVPNRNERIQMFKYFLPERVLTSPSLEAKIDYPKLSEITDGFTGADIKLVCKESIMRKMRRLFIEMDMKEENKKEGQGNYCLQSVTDQTVMKALEQMKPLSNATLNKYRKWNAANLRN